MYIYKIFAYSLMKKFRKAEIPFLLCQIKAHFMKVLPILNSSLFLKLICIGL